MLRKWVERCKQNFLQVKQTVLVLEGVYLKNLLHCCYKCPNNPIFVYSMYTQQKTKAKCTKMPRYDY